MTITIHFGHWWLYVLAGIGGIVVGGLVIYALFCWGVRQAIGKGLNW